MKKVGKLTMRYIVPYSDVCDYESAWDINQKDMIECYAVMQKWTDQAISLDEFFDVSHNDAKININELMKLWLYRQKMGLKTHYYTNTKTSGTDNLEIKTDNQESDCESCKL